MVGLRNNNNIQNVQWVDYVGDIFWGVQLINQLVFQYFYFNDVLFIDELRYQNIYYVIFLIFDVVKKIFSLIILFDYIYFIIIYFLGIKDIFVWLVNVGKLMIEFDDNGKIIFNFNVLKYIKVSYFEIFGEKYIKIIIFSFWFLEKFGKYIFFL